ncbi:MAG: hypothetical protein ACXAC2_06010, partial [Candidatus Kariarchaeaceae archaeon]
ADSNLCATCEENPIVIQLGAPLDYRYLDGKNALAGQVTVANSKGVTVDLGEGFIGWFRPQRDFRYKQGQTVAVRLRNPLTRDSRGNSVPVLPISSEKKYKVVKKTQQVHEMTLAELMSKPGNIGKFTGQVIDIYFMKSANITLFTLIDSSGKKVQGAVHSSDGFKSYPNITNSNVVQIVARYKVINEQDRLQIFSIDKVKQHEAFEFFDELAAINIQTGGSVDETTFFIESSLYDQLKPSFVKAANRIRIATLRNQNIITRYHSPCVDGVCGAYAIDFGIKKFVEAKGTNPQEFKRNIRRIPQRNSTLEVREVVRDLSFATDDGFNTRNLPLYVLVDVGSDEESKAALAICKSYGVDVVIVDTHAVAEGNEELAQSFINPSKLNTEEKVTTAMLSVELAKFISPETDVSSNLLQLSVISGLADDVSGTEYGKYLEIVEQNEYDLNRLGNILSALDYVIFGLRHFDGGQIVRDLLGINLNHERTTELIEGIAPTSKSLFSIAVKSAQANVEKSVLGDDKTLVVLDIDNFASKYEYPSHSSIISAIHSAAAEEESGTVITLGLSEDYLLIKNSALDFNFTEFLTQLQEELLNLGISGNGQNQSGSIQYLSGFKDQVFETMKNFLK